MPPADQADPRSHDPPDAWRLDRAQGVPINDALVVDLPVHDGGEPLVDLRGPAVRVAVDPRHLHADGLAALAREGVAERLRRASDALPGAVRLLVVEAYRPPSVQARWFADHLATVAAANPELSRQEQEAVAALHIAPPHVAPHSAGAAVDVTLLGPDGVELDMGTAVDDTPADSGNRCFTTHPAVTGPARRNRDLLCAAMASAGLVNYGPEWWHWSYGDRYWALRVGAPAAVYAEVPIEVARQALPAGPAAQAPIGWDDPRR